MKSKFSTKPSKFNIGEEVVTNEGIALIMDVWYAHTNLKNSYEYKCFTQNGVEYFWEDRIIAKV